MVNGWVAGVLPFCAWIVYVTIPAWDLRIRVCPEQAARMFVQFCLFGLRAGIRLLTHIDLFVWVEGYHPLTYGYRLPRILPDILGKGSRTAADAFKVSPH